LFGRNGLVLEVYGQLAIGAQLIGKSLNNGGLGGRLAVLAAGEANDYGFNAFGRNDIAQLLGETIILQQRGKWPG
jgi:hypothetical protein